MGYLDSTRMALLSERFDIWMTSGYLEILDPWQSSLANTIGNAGGVIQLCSTNRGSIDSSLWLEMKCKNLDRKSSIDQCSDLRSPCSCPNPDIFGHPHSHPFQSSEVASCARPSEAKFAECPGTQLCGWCHPGLPAHVIISLDSPNTAMMTLEFKPVDYISANPCKQHWEHRGTWH